MFIVVLRIVNRAKSSVPLDTRARARARLYERSASDPRGSRAELSGVEVGLKNRKRRGAKKWIDDEYRLIRIK